MSIVIPTLNEEEHIGKLLRFINGKLKIGDEILVVDANSSDNTIEIVQDMGVDFISCDVQNRAIQMNLGAKKTVGEILYFVHADTCPPESFRRDVPDAINDGFPMGGYRFKFNSTKSILKLNSWFTRFEIMTFRGGDQTMFFKRGIFNELGGYNEDFSIMEEYDLLKRAKKNNIPFKVMPKNVVVSDRKYNENSYLKVSYANLVAMRMFNKGVDPQEIKRKYFSLLKHPKS